MATLVLSTVGTALGGPVGSAIGTLIGQSIDQEVLAPSRRGPRLGDLSVQSSSYGTQIPRIYGTMRVAGSVIWSTNLVEGSETTGAKGQPDTAFGYSVSLAVALSSRPIAGVGRIWADGKLIRDAAGVFRVGTEFRLHSGSEDQDVDPLIASIEGLSETPGYRGLAVAVFEDLELVEFGNRIPFLTFEIFADEASPDVGSIVTDASGGVIMSAANQQVAGFAAYGQSIKAAVEPLVTAFAIPIFDDGRNLRPPSSRVPALIAEEDLASDDDGTHQRPFEREQASARSLPGTLSLAYYDATRDFQAGEARALAGSPLTVEERQLPVVLQPEMAMDLAQQVLARRWRGRDRLTLRMPPSYLGLEPGQPLQLGGSRSVWTVERVTLNGFVAVAELRPAELQVAAPARMSRGSGRTLAAGEATASDVAVAIFELPDPNCYVGTPTLTIAVSSSGDEWSRKRVELRGGGQRFEIATPSKKATLGRAATILGPADPCLIDAAGSVEICLLDQSQWLTSCDDDELIAGTNLALLGRELLQFGEATPLGQGRFVLRRLLRGRLGTEWATSRHSTGEAFVLIEPSRLQSVALPVSLKGVEISAHLPNRDGGAEWHQAPFEAESMRPLSPVHLRAWFNADGDLHARWTRRSRGGWAWVDEIDAPLAETREEYRLTVTGREGSLEIPSGETSIKVSAANLRPLGSGAASVEVRQIGDWGVSRACQAPVTIA